MKLIRNPELKGILVLLLIVFVLAGVLAGFNGKFEQWGLPWFGGGKIANKIIFVSDRSGTNEVYSMDLDGSHQEQLTEGASVLSAPAISPAGNKIIFIGMQGSVSQVMGIGARGGTPYPITTSSNPKRQPGFSPDGKRVSYIEAGRVFIADLNGSNPDAVLPTEREMATAMSDPMGRGALPIYTAYAWRPDGGSMAAVAKQNQISDALVYLPELEEEGQKFETPIPQLRATGIAWAAGAPVMAASIQAGKDQALVFVFNASEKQLRPVFGVKKVLLGAPGVSPDGTTVVVPVDASAVKQPSGLLAVEIESGKAALICRGLFGRPVFSPAGDAIIATRIDKAGKKSLVKIERDSGKVTTLAARGNCFDAVWSPSSQ